VRLEVNAVMPSGNAADDVLHSVLLQVVFGLIKQISKQHFARMLPILSYPEGCAAPGYVRCQRNARGPLSKLERTPPQRKINVTSKSPVGDISVVTLIRTDTTLDHSQKAEKV